MSEAAGAGGVAVDDDHHERGPVLLSRMRAAVSGQAEVPLWTLTTRERAQMLVEFAGLRAQLAVWELSVIAQAEAEGGVQTEYGLTDTVTWLTTRTAMDRRDAVARVRLAAALADPVAGRGGCGEAMARGEVSEDQAQVIDRALAEFETTLPAESRDQIVEVCAEHLVRAAVADGLGPRQLRQLGRQVLERVAPHVADDQLRQTLEAEERRAAQKCRLSMVDDGHGMTWGRFQIPTVRAAAFRKYLLAGAAPKHRCATGNPIPAEPPVTAQRLGEAFCELIDRYPVDRLPDAGGVTAQLVVTMDLAQLTGDGPGANRPVLTDMDEHLSAALARMWACEAGIVPQVLSGKSVVLDQGRSRRFHTPAQRRAIATRDQTCTVHGCDTPPALCHVHHDVPWATGGQTDVKTGRLLCPRHHRAIHDPRAQVRKIGHGRITVTRM